MGVTALSMEDGTLHRIFARNAVLATRLKENHLLLELEVYNYTKTLIGFTKLIKAK